MLQSRNGVAELVETGKSCSLSSKNAVYLPKPQLRVIRPKLRQLQVRRLLGRLRLRLRCRHLLTCISCGTSMLGSPM